MYVFCERMYGISNVAYSSSYKMKPKMILLFWLDQNGLTRNGFLFLFLFFSNKAQFIFFQ